jgi:hypothetical protein
MRTLVLALALASIAGAQPRPATAFDPAGKWTYSTQDENGNPISGTMDITGTPGAYSGTIVGGGDQPLQITGVYTSSSGAVVLANLPDGATAFIKISKEADGKIKCNWAPVPSLVPATLTRSGGL